MEMLPSGTTSPSHEVSNDAAAAAELEVVTDWAITFKEDSSGLTQFTNLLLKDEKVDVASCFFCCYKVRVMFVLCEFIHCGSVKPIIYTTLLCFTLVKGSFPQQRRGVIEGQHCQCWRGFLPFSVGVEGDRRQGFQRPEGTACANCNARPVASLLQRSVPDRCSYNASYPFLRQRECQSHATKRYNVEFTTQIT